MSNEKCPVCGTGGLEFYDICGECGWENGPAQSRDHNLCGGANALSVNEARIEHFLRKNASTREAAEKLRREYSAKLRDVRCEEKAEERGEHIAALREEYVDRLNDLLQGIS